MTEKEEKSTEESAEALHNSAEGSGEALQKRTGYLSCPVCKEPIKEKGQATHFRNKHPELIYDDYADQFEPCPPPPEIKVRPEDREEGLAKTGVQKLLAELKDTMEVMNVPGGKNAAEKRKKILFLVEKAPKYRNWDGLHGVFSTAGVDPLDAKHVCDIVFSQVDMEELKKGSKLSPDVAKEGATDLTEDGGVIPKGANINDYLKQVADRFTLLRTIETLSGGKPPAVQNPRGSHEGEKALTPEELAKILEEQNRKTTENFMKIMDERDKREKEKEKERITDARFAALEQAARQGAFSGKPVEEEPKGPWQPVIDAIVGDYSRRVQERSTMVEGKMVIGQDELKALAQEMKSSPIPEGISPAVAQIEIAKIQGQAARETAREARKGNESVAGAVNSFASNLGKSIVDAYERNKAAKKTRSQQEITEPSQKEKSGVEPELIKIKGKPVLGTDDKPTGLLELKCPTKNCDAVMTYEEGTSHPIKCPKCGSEFQISPQQ